MTNDQKPTIFPKGARVLVNGRPAKVLRHFNSSLGDEYELLLENGNRIRALKEQIVALPKAVPLTQPSQDSHRIVTPVAKEQ